MEMKTLVENPTIETEFAAMGAYNAVQLYGVLPKDTTKLLVALDEFANRIQVNVGVTLND